MSEQTYEATFAIPNRELYDDANMPGTFALVTVGVNQPHLLGAATVVELISQVVTMWANETKAGQKFTNNYYQIRTAELALIQDDPDLKKTLEAVGVVKLKVDCPEIQAPDQPLWDFEQDFRH